MKNVNMRIVLTIISFSLVSSLYAQIIKRDNPLLLYGLAIDTRINQGDTRLPKSININDNLWNELREMQSIKSSTKLDSILKIFVWNFPDNKKRVERIKTLKKISANRILPYLKNTATIYKDKDWFLDASSLVFSENGNQAILILRTSSKIEILDLCIYFFEQKSGKWILSEELSPWLI